MTRIDIAWHPSMCVGGECESESILIRCKLSEWHHPVFFLGKVHSSSLPPRSRAVPPASAKNSWMGERRRRRRARRARQVKTREMPTFISPCCCLLSFLQAGWSTGMHSSESFSNYKVVCFKFTFNVSSTSTDQCMKCILHSLTPLLANPAWLLVSWGTN